MKLEATIGDKLILTDIGREDCSIITTLTQRLENGIIYVDTINKHGRYGNDMPTYTTVEELLNEYVKSWDKVEVIPKDVNKQRALYIATKFIPKESISLYYAELCKGCRCNNDEQEYLECCHCEDGNLYKGML